MAYTDRILGQDEQVLHRTRLHWIIFLWPGLCLLAALFAMPLINDLLATRIPGLVLAILAAAWFGGTYLEHLLEEHVVTNKRVISRWGILRRDVFAYPLRQIDGIDVRQGLLARLFGYGTVEIHTSAETHGTTGRRFISEPERWRTHILEAIDNMAAGNADEIERAENDDPASRLRDLESLLNEGLISRDEYDQKRSEILSDL